MCDATFFHSRYEGYVENQHVCERETDDNDAWGAIGSLL
jgi:hypothetical protein